MRLMLTKLGVVEAANFNSPGQVVIAGDNKMRLILACELMKEAGAKRALILPVSVPITLLTYERCSNGI